MRVYIKQRVFSFGDKYDVYDKNQNVLYKVEGTIFSIGAKLSIKDCSGKELYFIKQKITFFLHHYEVYKDDILVANINQQFSLFTPKLTVTSSYGNFNIDGNLFSMDFTIYKDSVPVGSVSKKWLSWGDTYELNINDGFDVDFFVALVIAIDNAIHKGNDQ